jgi:hypothetical protein
MAANASQREDHLDVDAQLSGLTAAFAADAGFASAGWPTSSE